MWSVDSLTRSERTYCDARFKRLECGSFQRPRGEPGVDHVEMDATDLAILLAGIELASVKRRPRYQCCTPRPTLASSAHGILDKSEDAMNGEKYLCGIHEKTSSVTSCAFLKYSLSCSA